MYRFAIDTYSTITPSCSDSDINCLDLEFQKVCLVHFLSYLIACC